MPIEIEPDPPEPEMQSPNNAPRVPSPEAKPDNTECHRSENAMYDFFFIFYEMVFYFFVFFFKDLCDRSIEGR